MPGWAITGITLAKSADLYASNLSFQYLFLFPPELKCLLGGLPLGGKSPGGPGLLTEHFCGVTVLSYH